MESFQQLDFMKLITEKEYMMKNIFYDIFKSILIGLNRQPPLFLVKLILNYLNASFCVSKKDELDSLLSNIAFFIKSIDQTAENSFFFEKVFEIVLKIFPKLAQTVKEDTTETFLEIIEEFIIIGLGPQVFDYNSYIRNLYNLLSADDGLIDLSVCFKLKSSILSIFTTLFLISLEKQNFVFSNFEVE